MAKDEESKKKPKKEPKPRDVGEGGPNFIPSDKQMAHAVSVYKQLLKEGDSPQQAVSKLAEGFSHNGTWEQAGWLGKGGKGSDVAKKRFESLIGDVTGKPPKTPMGKKPLEGPKAPKPVKVEEGGRAPGRPRAGAEKQVSRHRKKEATGEHWIEIPSKKTNPNAVRRRKILLDRNGTIIGGDVPSAMRGDNVQSKDTWSALTDPGSSEPWSKVKKKKKHKALGELVELEQEIKALVDYFELRAENDCN